MATLSPSAIVSQLALRMARNMTMAAVAAIAHTNASIELLNMPNVVDTKTTLQLHVTSCEQHDASFRSALALTGFP